MTKLKNIGEAPDKIETGLPQKIRTAAIYLFLGMPVSLILFVVLVPFAGAFFMGIYFGSIILLTGIQPIGNRLRKKGVDPVLVEKYEMRAFYAVVATIAVLTLAALVKTYLLSGNSS